MIDGIILMLAGIGVAAVALAIAFLIFAWWLGKDGK